MASINGSAGSRLLETGAHSDFIIECKGRRWNVHKLIVGAASSHFERLCYSHFKESNQARAVLNEEDPSVMDLVITWLYTGEYTIPEETDVSDPRRPKNHPKHQEYIDECTLKELRPHLGVYLCADRFFIEDLKASTSSKLLSIIFRSTLSRHAETTFLDTVFSNTRSDDILRGQIIKRAFKHADWLQERPKVADLIKKYEPVASMLGKSMIQDTEDKVSKSKKALQELREFLRYPQHCVRCGKIVVKNCVLIRFLKEEYAVDCADCKHRQWSFGI